MTGEIKRPASTGCSALVSRVAQPEDVPALLRLARETDTGSIRADGKRITYEIEICHQTLQGEIGWEQGMLFLVTDCYPRGHGPTLVGQSKIRWAFDACWLRIQRTEEREGKATTRDVLIYHSEPSGALEFAGNAVLEKYQSQGIGGFQTKARILFLHLFDLPGVSRIFADFLTLDVDGRYPFYEKIVRPWVDNRRYEELDALRHEARGGRVPFFEGRLGPADRHPAREVFLDSLPAEIRNSFGFVRPKSLPAARALGRYGFTPCNKYDLLDGGQYMETSVAELRVNARTKTLLAEQVQQSTPVDDLGLVVFSPRRAMSRFTAARGNAAADGERLMINQDLFRALGLTHDEPVEVLL